MNKNQLVGLVGLVSLLGCNRIDPYLPYQATNLSDLEDKKGNKVILYGFPKGIGNNSFSLSYGKNEVYCCKDTHSLRNFSSDFPNALRALESEGWDDDSNMVKLYGVVSGPNSVEGDFLVVDDKQYTLLE